MQACRLGGFLGFIIEIGLWVATSPEYVTLQKIFLLAMICSRPLGVFDVDFEIRPILFHYLARNGRQPFTQFASFRCVDWNPLRLTYFDVVAGIRELELKKLTIYRQYFGVHSHSPGLIKKSPPRIIKLTKINLWFDGRL